MKTIVALGLVIGSMGLGCGGGNAEVKVNAGGHGGGAVVPAQPVAAKA